MNSRNNTMAEFHLSSISRNRNSIYGLTILWIAFYHATLTFQGKWAHPINAIKNMGNIGVDIFLMMAGISLFYSFNADHDIIRFYCKRLQRVLLPSLLVGIPFFFYTDILAGKGVVKYFMDLSGINLFFDGRRTIWFVAAILIFYFLYPAIYYFYKKRSWSVFALLELVSAVLLLNLAIRCAFPTLWSHSEILFRRIPVFLVGTYLGKFVYEDSSVHVRKIGIIVTAGLFFLCFAVYRLFFDMSGALSRYSYLPLSFSFICLFSVIGDFSFVERSIGRLAPYTLEIYLTHEKLIALFTKLLQGESACIINIASIISSLLVSFALKSLEKFILKKRHFSVPFARK